jgi:hypothetical protein
MGFQPKKKRRFNGSEHLTGKYTERSSNGVISRNFPEIDEKNPQSGQSVSRLDTNWAPINQLKSFTS